MSSQIINGINVPNPVNEPVKTYAPNSPERDLLKKELERQKNETIEIPLIIGGKEIRTGNTNTCIMPHNHKHILATYHLAGEKEVQLAMASAMKARHNWEQMAWHHRAAIFLKAADLVAGKYRYLLNAATMLNQSKNPHQAEIDAACEMADFLRFNAFYMHQIHGAQPIHNAKGSWNTMEYRGLEGFILAVSPFNFTAIGGNLVAAPAIMGNVVVWKPASTSVLSNYYLMKIFMEAGLPAGVINFVPGPGNVVGPTALASKDLAGIHFTGSTNVFNGMWKTVGENIDNYRGYPRIVGETGGKDFIFLHPSADIETAAVAMVQGAFEYQGQKCSAASRAYVPRSLWEELKHTMAPMLEEIKLNTGAPEDFCFYNAVIDKNAYNRTMKYLERVKQADEATIVFGGNGNDEKGYFIEPTIVETTRPDFVTMEEEIFAPVLTVYVYEDHQYIDTLHLCDTTSPYALTGALFANDREAVAVAQNILRHAAGNFYINDKPTGAVVGQQPFGGARKSGTNDKAGSHLNLLRWANPRTVKESFAPARDFRYPFMENDISPRLKETANLNWREEVICASGGQNPL